MKHVRLRLLHLTPLLLLLLAACAKPAQPQPSPAPADTAAPVTALHVCVDRSDLTLSRDTDTRLVYTVTTPADCVSVHIGQRTTSDRLYSDLVMQGPDAVIDALSADPDAYAVTVNEQSFDRSNAEVAEQDGGLVWTLPVDFGDSALYGAGVRAVRGDGTELSAVADAFIRYPEIDIFSEGMYKAWEAYILTNSTEPFYFTVDLDKSGLDYLRHNPDYWIYYAELGGADAVFCLPKTEEQQLAFEQLTGVRPENPWDAWLACNTPVYGENALVRPYENNLTVFVPETSGHNNNSPYVLPPRGAMLLCVIEGEGTKSEFIFDSCRAAVCWRYGVAPDAALFPGAAYLYGRAAEILPGILKDGMSDYEKVKAIHDWMLADGKNHSQEGEFLNLSPEEQTRAIETSWGFLMGYGGDCMGWSDTFRMLCGMAGVRCSNVSCSSVPGGPSDASDLSFDHSFNVAVLDGEVYYFDVYWDGAGSGYENPPYTYFAMTSEEAAKSHTWPSYAAWGPPDATSLRDQTDPVTGERIGQ